MDFASDTDDKVSVRRVDARNFMLSASARCTMSLTSRDKVGAAATRRNAASARARRSAFERAPAAERSQQACGDLRIFRSSAQHVVGNEFVAGAIGAVELGRVALRECADRASARGWDWTSKRRDASSARARDRGCLPRGSSACRVNHLSMIERIAGIALVEILERLLRAAARRAATASPSAAMRSVILSAAWYCASRALDRLPALPVDGEQVETGILQERAGPALAASG